MCNVMQHRQPHQMQGLDRRRFLNWEQMLACSTSRAMGNASDGTLLDVRSPPRNPWLDGWADVLDIINSHAQARMRARISLCFTRSSGRDVRTCASLPQTLHSVSPLQPQLMVHARTPSDPKRRAACTPCGLTSQHRRPRPPSEQRMANLSGVELSRAALSHAPLVSTGRPAWLLPDTPVTPDLKPMTDGTPLQHVGFCAEVTAVPSLGHPASHIRSRYAV